MNMRLLGSFLLLLVGICGTTPVRAEHEDMGGVVVCESRNHRQQFCSVDTSGGVRIARQLSRSACDEGQTWGFDRRGIWVTDGCSAEFEVGGRSSYGRPFSGNERPQPYAGTRPGYGSNHNSGSVGTIVCESQDDQYQYCPVRIRRGVTVDLVSQFSRSECEYNYSWGYDRKGIWVDHGCAGEFEIR